MYAYIGILDRSPQVQFKPPSRVNVDATVSEMSRCPAGAIIANCGFLCVNPRVFLMNAEREGSLTLTGLGDRGGGDTQKRSKIESLTSVFCRFLFVLWSIIVKGHIWFESSFTHGCLLRPVCSTHPRVFICARLWTVALPEEALNSQRGFKSPRSEVFRGIPTADHRTMPSRGWGWYGTEGKSMDRLS